MLPAFLLPSNSICGLTSWLWDERRNMPPGIFTGPQIHIHSKIR